jgi:hypothetical protein
MHILMLRCESLLDVSGIFLATRNGYNSEGGWNLEVEISIMQGSFESIKKTSFEDGIVGVEHIDYVKGDVLCARVLCGTE